MPSRILFSLVLFGFASPALAQIAVPQSQTAIVAKTVTVTGQAVASGRAGECKMSAIARRLKGNDRLDDLQICIATARLDCVKQAVEKKIYGPGRADFIRTCVGG